MLFSCNCSHIPGYLFVFVNYKKKWTVYDLLAAVLYFTFYFFVMSFIFVMYFSRGKNECHLS